jgi:hypothetical protein
VHTSFKNCNKPFLTFKLHFVGWKNTQSLAQHFILMQICEMFNVDDSDSNEIVKEGYGT